MYKELDVEVVVQYSDKYIDKESLAEIVYYILKENIGEGETKTNEEESHCA